MKKLVSLALALALLLAMSACSAPTATQAPTPTPAAPAPDAPTGSEPADASEPPAPVQSDYTDPIVVSMNVMDAEKCGNSAKNEFIKEKFNLTFDYVPVNWGDWNEKIRTWINTDDAPDLIWWDLKGATANEYKSWAKQGAFAAIPEDKLAAREKLNEKLTTMRSIEALKVDGKLYAWPSSRNNPEEAQNCYTSVWTYRRDWAKAVGLYQEDEKYTWEEWIALLRAVIAQDPGKNGTGNTAGLVMANWAFPHAPALFIGPPAAEGNETCSYIKDANGQYVWPVALPEYKTGVKWTYDMYQEGLIYKDNIQFKAAEQDDMFKAGLAFANYNVAGNLNTWSDDMMRDGTITEREALGNAIVYSYDGKWYMTQTEDYWTVTALNHKMEEAKMDRILDFWNYLMTDEGIRLRWLGIEGKDYKVTGDGLRDVEILWDFDEATQSYISPYTNDRFNEENGASNGYPNSPADPPYMAQERDKIWAAMASDPNLVIKEFDYVMSFGSAPNKDKYGTFGTEVKEKLIQLIATPGIDVEAEWDKYVESMMPRVQPVLDELNGGQLQ